MPSLSNKSTLDSCGASLAVRTSPVPNAAALSLSSGFVIWRRAAHETDVQKLAAYVTHLGRPQRPRRVRSGLDEIQEDLFVFSRPYGELWQVGC